MENDKNKSKAESSSKETKPIQECETERSVSKTLAAALKFKGSLIVNDPAFLL